METKKLTSASGRRAGGAMAGNSVFMVSSSQVWWESSCCSQCSMSGSVVCCRSVKRVLMKMCRASDSVVQAMIDSGAT